MSNKFKRDWVRSMYFLYKLTSNILVKRNVFQILNSYLLKQCATKRRRQHKSVVNYAPVWIVQTDTNNLKVYQVRPLLEPAELNRKLLQTTRLTQPDWHILLFITIRNYSLGVSDALRSQTIGSSAKVLCTQLLSLFVEKISCHTCHRQVDWN